LGIDNQPDHWAMERSGWREESVYKRGDRCAQVLSLEGALILRGADFVSFTVVELVALRRVVPRPAAQECPSNEAAIGSASDAESGGVVAARQPLPATIKHMPDFDPLPCHVSRESQDFDEASPYLAVKS